MNGFMDKLAEKIMPLANKLGAKSILDCPKRCIYAVIPADHVWVNCCRC